MSFFIKKADLIWQWIVNYIEQKRDGVEPYSFGSFFAWWISFKSPKKNSFILGIYFKTKGKRYFLLSNFGGWGSITWPYWWSWSLKISKKYAKNTPYPILCLCKKWYNSNRQNFTSKNFTVMIKYKLNFVPYIGINLPEIRI